MGAIQPSTHASGSSGSAFYEYDYLSPWRRRSNLPSSDYKQHPLAGTGAGAPIMKAISILGGYGAREQTSATGSGHLSAGGGGSFMGEQYRSRH